MASLTSVTIDICLPPPIAPLSPIVLRPCHHVALLPSPMASRPCPHKHYRLKPTINYKGKARLNHASLNTAKKCQSGIHYNSQQKWFEYNSIRFHYMIASSLNFNLLGCTILPGFISSGLSSMTGAVQRSTFFICHLGNVRSSCRILIISLIFQYMILSNLCPKGSLHRFDLGVIWSFGELPLDKEIFDSPTDSKENTVKIYALAYIMMHSSTQLFINKLGTQVHNRWLPYVTNLDKLRKYSWSFAMLAWLYCDTIACVASLT
ncbi:hypothetical protein Ahy_B01g053966 [Arachis hypogaea]|uniref:Aminotransferase-like plant mobile domain-containing protein n=1 Tax=Arachis hypogaea TaxID=3818 RepID=A0A445AT04_ARAHY|nr:hypothetical protein Ahy_B01g053966 [Arachis hypogaea]